MSGNGHYGNDYGFIWPNFIACNLNSDSYNGECHSDMEINLHELYCYIGFNLVSSKAIPITLMNFTVV
jgi:hypothetical protein